MDDNKKVMLILYNQLKYIKKLKIMTKNLQILLKIIKIYAKKDTYISNNLKT